MRAVKWEVLLASHPDREIVEYLLRGIRQGFRISFDREKCRLRSRTQNMSSANERPEIVSKYTAHEQVQGRLVEVSARKTEQWKVHPSPFGVIPQKSNPHKWRLIVDLSSPEDHSVNDGISNELASLHYITVDKVTAHIAELGKGSSNAEMNVKQADRNIPVHPADSLLLGMTRYI